MDPTTYDDSSLEISFLSRQIFLLSKHIGFARRVDNDMVGEEQANVLQLYNNLFRSLCNFYSLSSPLQKCLKNNQKITFGSSKEGISNNASSPQDMKITWLNNVVYLLFAINYRKEVNHLEGSYTTKFLTKNNNEGAETCSHDMGILAFKCALSHGTQLLTEVIVYFRKYRSKTIPKPFAPVRMFC